jgi:hypothetical protein
MTLFFELLGMGAIAIVVLVVPLSYLMAKLLVNEPPTAAEWLRVVGVRRPTLARKLATAFTSAVSAVAPTTIATTSAVIAFSDVSHTQIISTLQSVSATSGHTKIM